MLGPRENGKFSAKDIPMLALLLLYTYKIDSHRDLTYRSLAEKSMDFE